jgi:hypothetical protein
MVFTKQSLIVEFFTVIRKLNRTGTDILEIRSFFNIVSGIRDFVPNTVEFMAVLKTYRPALFHEFKRSLVQSTSMWFLANVNMDVGQALLSLGITDEEQLQHLIKG